jgi:hypothetical protein
MEQKKKEREMLFICAEGRKKRRGKKRKTEKLYKKWQELMLMVLYKYYF